MDQNIVFIFPLCSILSKLKEELDKKSEFTVFEVDLINEYEQLIENLENAITFSSDHKKTNQYLELCQKTVTKRNYLNIIVSKKKPSAFELNKMEKKGLDEFLADNTQLKSLMFKVNNFYKTVVTQQANTPFFSSKKSEKIDTQSLQRIERLVMPEEEASKHSINEISTKATEVIDTKSRRNVERLLNEEKDAKQTVRDFSPEKDNDHVFMTETLSKELAAKSKKNKKNDTESEQDIEHMIINEKKTKERLGDQSQENPEDFLYRSKNENGNNANPVSNFDQAISGKKKANRKLSYSLQTDAKDLNLKTIKLEDEAGSTAREFARLNEVEKKAYERTTRALKKDDTEKLNLNNPEDSKDEFQKNFKNIEKKINELFRKRGSYSDSLDKELYSKSMNAEKIESGSEKDFKGGDKLYQDMIRKMEDLSQKQSKRLNAKQKTSEQIKADSEQDLDKALNKVSRNLEDLSQLDSQELYSKSKKHESTDANLKKNIKKNDHEFKDNKRRAGDPSQEETLDLYLKTKISELIDTESLQQTQRLASTGKPIIPRAIGERIVTDHKKSDKNVPSPATNYSLQDPELNLEKTISHAQAEDVFSFEKTKRVEIEDALIQQLRHHLESEEEVFLKDGDSNTIVYDFEKRKIQEAQIELDVDVLQLKASRIKNGDVLDLPEIVFFPPQKIFDPVAFYMEILYSNADVDFKKKYLKMFLSKVHRAQLFLANIEGAWEELTPLSLQEINVKLLSVPEWINEGRNEKENYFVLPVIFNNKFYSAVGLIVPEKLSHEKMIELEFWCYLSRCLCS